MNRKEYNHSVDELSDGLYNFALRYTASPTQSSDAVQDSFVALWEHRGEVKACNAKKWLMRVLYHRLVDQHRYQSRLSQMPAPDTAVAQHESFELSDSLQLALAALPEVQRSLVLLRDLEGYAYREMASMLNITEQQVMVYLYRARQTMKKVLTNELDLR
ncbi:MAG: RNA polymerase sigma factor [Bacteroidales bacterium]|nr:RNA polymerase sigma factor [Bacteroidales bacterium]